MTGTQSFQLTQLRAEMIFPPILWSKFFWAVGSGQFDDLDTPAMRVILDDDTRPADDSDK